MQNFQEVQLAVESLQRELPEDMLEAMQGGCGLILGTGLSGLAASLATDALEIPFAAIPAFPAAGVSSHKGSFLFSRLNHTGIAIQCGRVHLYEGYTPAQICMGVRLMRGLGISRLILTNSAGALNPLFKPGSLMLASDFINHTGLSPLTGANHDAWGERFPDMSAPFSASLTALAAAAALENRIYLEKGVYIGVHGPEMETPAETRMYRHWGADAIGMSTVLEIIAARHLGMKCISISCLTNSNLPDCMQPAPLASVLAMADKAAPALGCLLKAILTGIDHADQC